MNGRVNEMAYPVAAIFLSKKKYKTKNNNVENALSQTKNFLKKIK